MGAIEIQLSKERRMHIYLPIVMRLSSLAPVLSALFAIPFHTPPHIDVFKSGNANDGAIRADGDKKGGDQPDPRKQKPGKSAPRQPEKPAKREGDKGLQRVKRPKKMQGPVVGSRSGLLSVVRDWFLGLLAF